MRTIGLPRNRTAETLAGSAGADASNPYSRAARAARQRDLVIASLVRCPQRSTTQHPREPL